MGSGAKHTTGRSCNARLGGGVVRRELQMMTTFLETQASNKHMKKVAVLKEGVGNFNVHQLFFHDMNGAAQHDLECPHIRTVLKRFGSISRPRLASPIRCV